jgi:hypothetical protein
LDDTRKQTQQKKTTQTTHPKPKEAGAVYLERQRSFSHNPDLQTKTPKESDSIHSRLFNLNMPNLARCGLFLWCEASEKG